MILLDENINENQRLQLRKWHIPARQIGVDLKLQGTQDESIIVLLCQQRFPTFFTRDIDFYHRRLCHTRYCLVYLDVVNRDVAVYVRRFLRHADFNTRMKRMGAVIQVTYTGIFVWRLHAAKLLYYQWVAK